MNIVKQISSSLLVRLVLLVGGFVTGILVVRAVGAEGKGVLSLLSSLTLMLSVAVGFGLPASVTYLFKQRRFANEELVGATILTWVPLTVVVGLFVAWQYDAVLQLFLGEALATNSFQPWWIWLSFATLPGLLLSSLLSTILIVNDNIKLFVLWNMLSQATGILLTWVLALGLGWGVPGVLIANLVVQLTPFVVAGWWLRYVLQIQRPRFSLSTCVDLFRISFSQYVVTLLATIFKRGEIIVLALLLDIRSLGYYAVAMGLYELLNEFPRSVVWPMVGLVADPERTDQGESTVRSIRLQIIVVVVLLLGSTLVIPWIIPLAYGQLFQAAVIPLLFMLPGVLFRTIHLGVHAYFIGVGKPGLMSGPVVIAAVLSLGLDLVLVPRLGMQGAAIATVIAEMSMAMISVFLFLRASAQSAFNLFAFRYSDFLNFLRLLSALANKYRKITS